MIRTVWSAQRTGYSGLASWRTLRTSAPMLCDSSARPEPELMRMTVKALQASLRERGLNVSGVKAELIQRILDAASPSILPVVAPATPGPSSPPYRSQSTSARTPASSQPAASAQASVPRTPTPRRSASHASPDLWRVASWNVAGLRGLLKKEEGVETLRRLVADEGVRVIFLQARRPCLLLSVTFSMIHSHHAFTPPVWPFTTHIPHHPPHPFCHRRRNCSRSTWRPSSRSCWRLSPPLTAAVA